MFALGSIDTPALLQRIHDEQKGTKPEELKWYYNMGLGQLLILRELQGAAEIPKTTHRIARSESWEQGVFYEFAKYIQSR